jgi:hypothetical protein
MCVSGPIYLDVSIRASMTAKTSFAHGDRGLSHELRAKSEVRAKTRSHLSFIYPQIRNGRAGPVRPRGTPF